MSVNRRKRARGGAGDSTETPIEPEATHDADYYFDDGDFVIRAGNALFKVHKFLLSRDSSMFKDMFVIPGGTDAANGLTDETALLVSDTVAAFRALLWVLYALPPELQAYLTNVTARDLDRILLVAEITNKYHFTTLEAWSMQVVRSAVPKIRFTQTTSLLLGRAMTIAERCSDTALSDVALTAWEALLRSGVNLAPLINILERDQLTCFSALTYYAQLSAMKIVRSGPPGSRVVTIAGCDGLSETQLARLLFARWSLDSEFLHLSKNPPTLPRGAECIAANHSAVCIREWNKLWPDYMATKSVLVIDSVDLLGRLNEVQKIAASHRRGQMHSTCRPMMVVAVSTLIATIKRNLGDHFDSPAAVDGVTP
ncbi:hypothetical protein C8F04DRAFT_1238437 [Mycena alexandri]|uniref:BTB domain-containing protein n=1 Tax=Mycena alexandri TaxID=1745969 RepID=A0AAD6SH43_9AGAR|nr:hypothetical protein C8F04DRAFT_1238437 [Mycena alexandri]